VAQTALMESEKTHQRNRGEDKPEEHHGLGGNGMGLAQQLRQYEEQSSNGNLREEERFPHARLVATKIQRHRNIQGEENGKYSRQCLVDRVAIGRLDTACFASRAVRVVGRMTLPRA